MKESERLRRKRCPTSGVAVEARKLGEDLEVEEFPVPEAASGFNGKPKCGIGHLGGQRREVLDVLFHTWAFRRNLTPPRALEIPLLPNLRQACEHLWQRQRWDISFSLASQTPSSPFTSPPNFDSSSPSHDFEHRSSLCHLLDPLYMPSQAPPH